MSDLKKIIQSIYDKRGEETASYRRGQGTRVDRTHWTDMQKTIQSLYDKMAEEEQQRKKKVDLGSTQSYHSSPESNGSNGNSWFGSFKQFMLRFLK